MQSEVDSISTELDSIPLPPTPFIPPPPLLDMGSSQVPSAGGALNLSSAKLKKTDHSPAPVSPQVDLLAQIRGGNTLKKVVGHPVYVLWEVFIQKRTPQSLLQRLFKMTTTSLTSFSMPWWSGAVPLLEAMKARAVGTGMKAIMNNSLQLLLNQEQKAANRRFSVWDIQRK